MVYFSILEALYLYWVTNKVSMLCVTQHTFFLALLTSIEIACMSVCLWLAVCSLPVSLWLYREPLKQGAFVQYCSPRHGHSPPPISRGRHYCFHSSMACRMDTLMFSYSVSFVWWKESFRRHVAHMNSVSGECAHHPYVKSAMCKHITWLKPERIMQSYFLHTWAD